MAAPSMAETEPRIAVRVPSWLAPHVPRFLANRRRDVDLIASSADTADFAAMQALGHKLKGSGAGYGFAAISDIGRAIERAARAGDADGLREGASSLAGYLERLDVTYT
jgi:HPt (histidine-containing phosphotransfer) domain-containing protein